MVKGGVSKKKPVEYVQVLTAWTIKIDPDVEDHFTLSPKDPEHWDMTKKLVRQNDGTDMLLFTVLRKGSKLHRREFLGEDT